MKNSVVSAQRGATLIIALIMLLLITVMVSSAFTLSGVSLTAVGNMQLRSEAIAAANSAIEQVVSSAANFSTPAASSYTIGSDTVSVAAPVCVRAVDVKSDSTGDPNPGLLLDAGAGSGSGAASGYQDTYWNIAATVDNTATGAKVIVNQGVKITLPASPNPCI